MATEEEIMNKIITYLQRKEKLKLESCYFITKKLMESFWDEIAYPEEETPEEEDDLSPFDMDEEDNSRDSTPRTVTRPPVKPPLVKKPNIRGKPKNVDEGDF